jgi:hypothetical protein
MVDAAQRPRELRLLLELSPRAQSSIVLTFSGQQA